MEQGERVGKRVNAATREVGPLRQMDILYEAINEICEP